MISTDFEIILFFLLVGFVVIMVGLFDLDESGFDFAFDFEAFVVVLFEVLVEFFDEADDVDAVNRVGVEALHDDGCHVLLDVLGNAGDHRGVAEEDFVEEYVDLGDLVLGVVEEEFDAETAEGPDVLRGAFAGLADRDLWRGVLGGHVGQSSFEVFISDFNFTQIIVEMILFHSV